MKKTTLKDCPSVHQVILEVNSITDINEDYIKSIVNNELDKIRQEIKAGSLTKTKEELTDRLVTQTILQSSTKLINVINGTGIVLHTGFGRAPFRGKHLKQIADRLDGYVNLEFNLETGQRGDRQTIVHDLLSAICGTESSLVVNNNAAAVLIALNEIADGGEVICSRGQMVEIGGSFRIPDIIEKSGAILKEVGTTNRTHLKDYEKAISKKTKLLLWVHTSNYIVKGFTKSVELKELVELGKKHSIPVMADLGSGALIQMTQDGLSDEIPVKQIVQSGTDITTFSGDKLLGGPQSGIIIGERELVNNIKKNPLYRVLRCDKITLGLLEETLRSYQSNKFSKDNLALSMLSTKTNVLKKRAEKVLAEIPKRLIKELGIQIVSSHVEAGSGSLPENKIDSIAISFAPKNETVTQLATNFRCGSIPVVGYIQNDIFYIDMRAILPNQLKRLIKAIQEI